MKVRLNHVSGSATCHPRFYIKKKTETANVKIQITTDVNTCMQGLFSWANYQSGNHVYTSS